LKDLREYAPANDRVLFEPDAGHGMSNIGSRMGYRIAAVRKRAL